MHENDISGKIIGAAIEVHRTLGPGLLESVYEDALCHEFNLREIGHVRQAPVPVFYKGVRVASDLRLDLLVEGRVIVELKALQVVPAVESIKLLTYLRLADLRLGLIVNFHEARLVDGVERVVNRLVEESRGEENEKTERRDAESAED